MTRICLFIVCFNVFCVTSTKNIEDELLGVVVIYRHGERVPIITYPNDPYSDSTYWPVSRSQLTNTGKRQLFELGQWFRKRYENFLPEKYSEKDIYVQSTDEDRTLMSAAVNLAGLYPPVKEQKWNDDILWQPIPIHTIPETDDAILGMLKPCPKYERLYSELMTTDYFVEFQKHNQELYNYLSLHSGMNVSDMVVAEKLYDTLLIEASNNFTLPSWAQKVFPDPLTRVVVTSFAALAFTPNLARLKTGPLLFKILNNFERIRRNDTEAKKFLMFSGHDVTLTNVLLGMELYDYKQPPYGSSLIFELRRNGQKDYVNIFYKRNETIEQMTLKKCDKDCEIGEFRNVLKPVLISLDEWERDCKDKLIRKRLIRKTVFKIIRKG